MKKTIFIVALVIVAAAVGFLAGGGFSKPVFSCPAAMNPKIVLEGSLVPSEIDIVTKNFINPLLQYLNNEGAVIVALHSIASYLPDQSVDIPTSVILCNGKNLVPQHYGFSYHKPAGAKEWPVWSQPQTPPWYRG